MYILLVTNQKDLTTDFLVRELKSRDIDFRRLNTETLKDFRVTITPKRHFLRLTCSSESIDIESVSSAYFRRPKSPLFKDISMLYREYVSIEWNAFLNTFYHSIGDHWFSHPNDILLAEDKPTQLKIAHDIGFKVPETTISNNLDSVQTLRNSHALVVKPLKQALLNDEENERIIFTSNIDSLTEKDRASISMSPVIFQQHIRKFCDIRVTVVGNQVFAVAIHSQDYEETTIDWRRGSNPNLIHEVFELPIDIRRKCIQIVKVQRLRFGAIDLIQDLDGDFWFLECNPNGQWAWIENRTGLRIAAAIADELLAISRQTQNE